MSTVGYYFKPRTKYPERIYVFFYHEQWAPRNMVHIGVSKQPCLYTRSMTPLELQDTKDCKRLPAGQYEDMKSFIDDERSAGVPEPIIAEIIAKLPPHWRNQYTPPTNSSS